MKIDVYFTVYNDEVILPYFLKHYSSFANRIFAFYDESTDRTKEILSQNPKVTIIDVEEHGINEGYWTKKLWTKYENLSRGKADYVMLVDTDEFIYHPNLIEVLKREKELGTQVIQPEGFFMMSDKFPTTNGQIYEEVKKGVPDFWSTKCCLFDPSIYIRFRTGRHSIAKIQRNAIIKAGSEIGIKMLHYRYLGDKYIKERDIKDFNRHFLDTTPPPFQAGKHHQCPDRTRGDGYKWIENNKSKAIDII
jgi:hypothetical protein